MSSIDNADENRSFSSSQPTDDPQTLRALLRTDLITAMRSRQPEVIAALRTALAAFDNAEAVAAPDSRGAVASGDIAGAQSGVGSTEAQRRELSIDEVRALLKNQIDDRISAAELYDGRNQRDAANRLRREADALTKYLTT